MAVAGRVVEGVMHRRDASRADVQDLVLDPLGADSHSLLHR